MKILFYVDQQEALRQGIDVPNSTVLLDVNPAELPQDERELLAETLNENRAERSVPYDNSRYNYTKILLVEPTVAGVRAQLQEFLAARSKGAAEKAAQDKECTDQAEQEVRQTIAEGFCRKDKTVDFDKDKEIEENPYSFLNIKQAVTQVPYVGSYVLDVVNADLRTQFEDFKLAAEKRRAEDLEAARPRLEAAYAAREEVAAQEKAAYEALYAQLPQALRERDAAGFADEDEVKKKLKALIRKREGYEECEGWSGCSECSTLTDAQYSKFKEIKEKTPKGATCTPKQVWDQHYRDATEDDDAEDIDSDGEVLEKWHFRTLVDIRWTAPEGIAVRATQRLPEAD